MRFHAVEETFVYPVSFEKFCGYANNVGIAPNIILDKWLDLPEWDAMGEEPEFRPGIRKLTVVRRV